MTIITSNQQPATVTLVLQQNLVIMGGETPMYSLV
jgi:hypothetical protein